MSDKPREWNLMKTKLDESNEVIIEAADGPYPGKNEKVRVIEYTAYESMKEKVRDLIIQLKDQGVCLPGEIDSVEDLLGPPTESKIGYMGNVNPPGCEPDVAPDEPYFDHHEAGQQANKVYGEGGWLTNKGIAFVEGASWMFDKIYSTIKSKGDE
jgi:hypothetical protein